MDLKACSVTAKGKKIEGDPLPGKYYAVDVPDGVSPAEAAREFKKAFPKSFFSMRFSRPAPPAAQAETRPYKPEAKK